MHFDKSWSLKIIEKHGVLRHNDLLSLRHVAKLLLILTERNAEDWGRQDLYRFLPVDQSYRKK